MNMLIENVLSLSASVDITNQEDDPILNELDGLGGSEGEAEDDDCDNYPADVRVQLPREAQMLHHISSISIPVRQLLTWLAADDEDYAQKFLAIRDDFYDRDEDGELYISEQYQIYDREQLARLRVGRRNKKTKRDIARKSNPKVERLEIHRSTPVERYGPNLEKGLALEEEIAAHWEKSDELDRAWEDFVETEGVVGLSANEIHVRRMELRLAGRKLDLEFSRLMARQARLLVPLSLRSAPCATG